MTKKHFQRAANLVQSYGNYDRMTAFVIENAFVLFFKGEEGAHFDEVRFRNACLPPEG